MKGPRRAVALLSGIAISGSVMILAALPDAVGQTRNSVAPAVPGQSRNQPPAQQQGGQTGQQQGQTGQQQGQTAQPQGQSGQQQRQTGTRQQIPNDAFVDQVKAKMDGVEKVLTGDGFERTHDRHYAKVNKGETEETTLTLNADIDYAIVTVCDDDCTNVDAKLFSSDNRELDMDTISDDFPVLEIKPAQTAEYKIVVSVPGCSARRCTIGIGVYGKRGGQKTGQ